MPPVDVSTPVLASTGGSTVRTKLCVERPLAPVAVTVIGNVPRALDVPASVAVPSPLSVKMTPDGRAPVSDRVTATGLAAHSEKVLAAPERKVVPAAVVNTGDASAVTSTVGVTAADSAIAYAAVENEDPAPPPLPYPPPPPPPPPAKPPPPPPPPTDPPPDCRTSCRRPPRLHRSRGQHRSR